MTPQRGPFMGHGTQTSLVHNIYIYIYDIYDIYDTYDIYIYIYDIYDTYDIYIYDIYI